MHILSVDLAGNKTETVSSAITFSGTTYYIIKDGVLLDTNYVLGSSESTLEQRDGYVYLKLYTPAQYETGISWFIDESLDEYGKMVWNFSNPERSASNTWGYVIYCGVHAATYAWNSETYGFSYTTYGGGQIVANDGGTFSTPKKYSWSLNPTSSSGYVCLQTYYRWNGGAMYRVYYLYDVYLY